jgi:hypothetical protein
MRAGKLATIAALATTGLVAAAMAQPAHESGGNCAARPEHTLSAAEEQIASDPWPSSAAAYTLFEGLVKGRVYRQRLAAMPPALRPKIPDDGGMGWAVPDEAYWRQIPAPAKEIPTDWSTLPAAYFNNTQVDGVREVRLLVHGDYDLWLLRDPLHELTACISVHRPTHRVWFMEIARGADGDWRPRRSKDPCYACHPSGPRVIRPILESGVDPERIELFNRRMLSYGACDFGGMVDPAKRGEAVRDDRCTGCHNGTDRGRLFGIHDRLIRFKTGEELTMPPDEPH